MAMTILCIQRLLSAQLVSDLATMTATLVADMEVWICVVDTVWGPLFPLVEFSLCAPVVAVVSVGPV